MKKKVIDFFKNEYVAVQNVTREVAELVRDMVWDRGIKPKDAARRLECDEDKGRF